MQRQTSSNYVSDAWYGMLTYAYSPPCLKHCLLMGGRLREFALCYSRHPGDMRVKPWVRAALSETLPSSAGHDSQNRYTSMDFERKNRDLFRSRNRCVHMPLAFSVVFGWAIWKIVLGLFFGKKVTFFDSQTLLKSVSLYGLSVFECFFQGAKSEWLYGSLF